MAKLTINTITKKIQEKRLYAVLIAIIMVLTAIFSLALNGKKSYPIKNDAEPLKISSIVDESFSDANTESALSMQQTELASLKTQMLQLKNAVDKADKAHAEKIKKIAELAVEQKIEASNHVSEQPSMFNQKPVAVLLHSVSFQYKKKHIQSETDRLNAKSYVPSGTFVRAVVLGGADADASVNGQSKNNGVMLFKILQPGTLPNGQRSHLQGCFVTASSYGDISSERAYVVLDKLSCAFSGQPIIDKSVTGWAFFGGKVGIKGIPLMRDNKVMQWAGISGAMSGIASAAQYSQSVQSISPLGSATTVPGSNIAPYAAYGGASKAAEVLSNYYVKRAEQYHPVIQVGSGNLVTIVFKDGFYLAPDEAKHSQHETTHETNFEVPPEVMNKIDKTYDTQPVSEVNP